MPSRSQATNICTPTVRAGNQPAHDRAPANNGHSVRLWLDSTAIPGKTSLGLTRSTSFSQWSEIGIQLAAVTETTSWWLGDWLIYGQDHYEGRYREAIAKTSLDYQTLRNYAWVARAFNVSRRRDTLSFAHHAEVAGLDQAEQDYWLRKAESGRWSRNRLRTELRESLTERHVLGGAAQGGDHDQAGKSTMAGRPPHTVSLCLSDEQLERFRRAARAQRRSLEDWVVAILDQLPEVPLA